MKLSSINPSNYQIVGEVEISTDQEIENIVKQAHIAQKAWSEMGVSKRVEAMTPLVEAFKAQKEVISELESKEMGMPISETLMDTDGSIDFLKWYLENAEKYLSPETTFESESEIHQVYYEPIGVVASIIPWNFPFANIIWGCMQSLLAGNAVVLKHSEECPLSSKLINEIINKHLPKGVFGTVYGAGDVGAKLVEQDVNMIAFIGSTKTGKSLYELAGKKFVKMVAELGGSAPGIIFEDADIDGSIGNVCFNRLLNQGQCCDGLKRLIVHESIYDEVVEKLKTVFESKKIGSAEDPTTETGPLVAKRQLDLLVAQVEDAKAKGATVVTGGESLEQQLGGAFYAPTILINVTENMRVWSEEVFGPVLPIMKFKTEEEALRLANGTKYGLGSYVYTKDQKRAERVAKQIDAGMVSINSTNYVQPFNPFGGYKNSGIGREHSKFGFHEAIQLKIVAKNK